MATSPKIPTLEITKGTYHLTWPDQTGLIADDVFIHPLTRVMHGLCTAVGPKGPIAVVPVEFFLERSYKEFVRRVIKANGNLRVDWPARLDYAGLQIRRALQQEVEAAAPTEDLDEGPIMPPLPDDVRVDEGLAAQASGWLDSYINWSKAWAPEAFPSYHEACGLWLLSSVSAKRIKVAHGRGLYPNLYIALCGRTTIYTKSSATDLARDVIKAAGLGHLLAPEQATPQALQQLMSGYIPESYHDMSQDERDAFKVELAFAGQKGWVYDEFGGLIQGMMKKDGALTSFREMLRVFYNCPAAFADLTISRGRNKIAHPYLALLANLTPADLRPYAQQGTTLWRDGFFSRVAIVTAYGEPLDHPFPEDDYTVPVALTKRLRQWHERLGIPLVDVQSITTPSGKDTGRYRLTRPPVLRETIYRMHPDVKRAFYGYRSALKSLAASHDNEDLDGSYGRLPDMALKIALLLTSLHDDQQTRQTQVITEPCWHRGQSITERWRESMHRIHRQIMAAEPSKLSANEQRVLAVIERYSAQKLSLSATEIGRYVHLSTTEVWPILSALERAGAIVANTTTRTTKYRAADNRSSQNQASGTKP